MTKTENILTQEKEAALKNWMLNQDFIKRLRKIESANAKEELVNRILAEIRNLFLAAKNAQNLTHGISKESLKLYQRGLSRTLHDLMVSLDQIDDDQAIETLSPNALCRQLTVLEDQELNTDFKTKHRLRTIFRTLRSSAKDAMEILDQLPKGAVPGPPPDLVTPIFVKSVAEWCLYSGLKVSPKPQNRFGKFISGLLDQIEAGAGQKNMENLLESAISDMKLKPEPRLRFSDNPNLFPVPRHRNRSHKH